MTFHDTATGLTSPGAQLAPVSAPTHAGFAPVNGIRMYYEMYGNSDGSDGVPLVLLHGGGSTIDSTFGRVIPFLTATRPVIAVEEQGHGRTSDRDQPFRFDTSADDVAGLLEHLAGPRPPDRSLSPRVLMTFLARRKELTLAKLQPSNVYTCIMRACHPFTLRCSARHRPSRTASGRFSLRTSSGR